MGRKSKAESRKKEILQTYFAIIKTEGLDGITVSNIAHKMQVNPSLIIHYFKTKEAIDNAFVHEIIERFKQSIPYEEIVNASSEMRFQKCLEWVSTPIAESNILISLFELANQNKIVKPLLEELFQEYEEFIVAEVDHAIKHGLIEEKVRETAIWILLATLHNVRNNNFFAKKMPPLDVTMGIYHLLGGSKN